MALTRIRGAGPAAVIIGVLLLWELGVRVTHVPAVILPAPSEVFADLASSGGYYLTQSLYTLETTLVGFALAVVFGIALAVAIVYSRFLEQTIYALLVSLNSIPKVAIAPLFVIWLGTGPQPKIAIALTIAIFVVVIDTVLAFRSVDPDMVDLARSLRASELEILWKIRFPHALPAILAAMKVAISLALVGAIVGEFVASQHGLGYVILAAQGMFQTPRVFAAIFALAVMGTVLFYVIDALEHRIVPWHVSQRRHA